MGAKAYFMEQTDTDAFHLLHTRAGKNQDLQVDGTRKRCKSIASYRASTAPKPQFPCD